ncbi:hypothetical protein ACFL1M_03185 [Patescibacteria group bacterium]
MSVELKDYEWVNNMLVENGIDSILYGSLGVSVYLGRFREFDDIDLLVDEEYVGNRWNFLNELMVNNGFNLVDEKEHEFVNNEGIRVAFARKDVLIRDRVCNPERDIVDVVVEGVEVRTLNVKGFIEAYTHSSTDGYRTEKRGDSDLSIVKKLKSQKSDTAFI